MAWSPADHDLTRIDAPNTPWTNFARTVQRQVGHFYTPVNLADLVAVVYQASAAGDELHTVGSGHAFEDVAVANDRLVSLSQLKSPLSYVLDGALTDARRAVQDDPTAPAKLFHVHGGITIGELNEVLAANGLALITLGGANMQALAGAVSTSTHGGDVGLPPLPDLVQAIHLVTAAGQQVWVERVSTPVTTDDRLRAALQRWEPVAEGIRIRRDDDLLNAVVVACGRFGVVYSVVLDVVSAFRLAEFTVAPPTATVLARLRAGVGGVDAGSGLAPLLAALPDPPADVGANTASGLRYLMVSLASARPAGCWVQRRWLTPTQDDSELNTGAPWVCGSAVAPAILAFAAQAIELEALHLALIPVVGVVWAAELTVRANQLRAAALGGATTGQAMAMATRAAWDSNLGWVVPHLNALLVENRVGTQQTRRRGPGHLVMTGDRASNRLCYIGRSTELVFPANTSAYLDFLDTILPVGPTLRQAGYVSLRFCAPSVGLISMHHLTSRLAVSIEVSSLEGMPASAQWVAFVERTGVRFGGRPHWGQEHKLTSAEVAQFYGDDLTTWRELLHSVSGNDLTFSNAFTRRCGLEPAPVPRAATISQIWVDGTVVTPAGFGALSAGFGDVEVGGSRDVRLELTNVGRSLLNVSVVGISGDFQPADLRVDGSFQAATGDYALVAPIFTPTRLGRMTGTLTLATDAPGTPELRVALSGTGHGPVMAVDRSSVDFGAVQPGVAAQETVRLRNDGDRTGQLVGAVVTDVQPAGEFTVTPESAALVPGQAVDLTVTFASGLAGPAGGRLRLYTRGASGPRGMLEVGLSADQLVAVPQLNPATLTFPDVPLRRTGDWQSVELANRGTGSLRILDVLPPADFECGGSHPPLLEAGRVCTLAVCFRPRSAGLVEGEVQVVDDAAGSPHAVHCSGTGLAVPLLVAQPQGVSFGGQPVETTGETRAFRFTNDGTAVMTVTSVDVIGTDLADFAVTPGAVPAAFPPEGEVVVEVGFRPTGLGARSALLRVTSDAYESPHLFPLDGFGTPAPSMTVDPTVLTFAPGPVGGRSGLSRVTLVNNGPAPIVVAAVEISGPHAADFAIRGGDCVPQATVAVSASCGVDLVATPSAVGRRTAQLRIDAVSGDAAVAGLTAIGVGADLAFDPPDTDFGTMQVGGLTDLHEVLLRNRGNAPVLVDTLGVEGDFVSASACAGNVLGPGGYCTVRLRMQAAAAGPRTGRIVARAGGQEAVATLHGIGAAPAVGLNPAAVTFPSTAVGTAAGPVTIILTNTGTWPLTPRNTMLRGPHAADFALLRTADGSVLRSGEARILRVAFTPGAEGERTASLEFEANVQAGPHRVTLTGIGTTP
jgi:hypothetical protein